MAVTADTVQVVMEADVTGYVRDLKRADTAFDSLISSMQTGLVQSNRAFSTLAVGANASANQVVQSATRMNTALSSNSMNVGNIAAQFQDIGVTAAMGMNPMIIALQQGTQLSAVLNQSLQAGVSPVRALGQAFVQIINPISLGTIALVALAAAAAQYFGTLLTDGKASEEELKKQEDAVRRVADQWGDAVPALKAYVDQLDRAERAADTEVALGVLSKDQMAAALADVQTLQAGFSDLDAQLRNLGADDAQVVQFYNAVNELGYALENGTATAEDVSRVTAALAVLQAGPASSALGIFTAGWNTLTAAIQAAIAAQTTAANQATPEALAAKSAKDAALYVVQQKLINDMTAEELALHNEINRIRAQADRDDLVLDEQTITDLAKERLAAEERRRQIRSDEKGSAKSISETEREMQAVVDLIDALEYEYSILGKSAEEQAISNALRQAGALATEEQRERIEELISATYSEQEAIRELDAMSKEWATTLQGATRGFIDDLIEGKSAAEAFSNVLSSIANKLLDVGLDNLFGKGGFNIAGLFGGGKASGGPVSSGTTYLVGEKGPELFTPSSAGNITPNHQLGGQGGDIVFAPVVDARGADEAAVARLETGLRRLAGEMVPTIRKEMNTASKKGR